MYLVNNCGLAKAAVIANDTLQTAVAAPPDLIGQDDFFDVSAADKYSYDDNVYRLSPTVTNLQTLNGIGPHPSRQDHINSASLSVDGQWSSGRQTVVVDLTAAENRFNINDNLNNTSSNDKVVWNWNVAGVLTGQIGRNIQSGSSRFCQCKRLQPQHHRDHELFWFRSLSTGAALGNFWWSLSTPVQH